MTISRHFRNISLPDMQKKMDELNDIVGTSLKPGQKVDMEALTAKVEAKNDPVLTSAFEKVRSQISNIEGPVQNSDAPVNTNGHQAKNVLNMFIDAKKSLAAIDVDGSGMIDRGEVLKSRLQRGATSAGKDLADGALYGAHKEIEERVVSFLERNPVVASEMSDRKRVYSDLTNQVRSTVPSERGQKAVMAHLQKILLQQGESVGLNYTGSKWVEGKAKDPMQPLEPAGNLNHYSQISGDGASKLIEKTLKSAERNFLRRLFGTPELSDKEVAKMVGTQDLEGYVKKIEKEIVTTQRASFEEIWFTGSDVQFKMYEGESDKGAIWGFRMQNDSYAGTDIDPKTVHGLDAGASVASTQRSAGPVADVDAAFVELNARMTPGEAAKIDSTFTFEVDGAKWFADFTKSEGPWIERKGGEAKSGFVISKPEKWLEIVGGELNPTAAFMSGLLEVKGDMEIAQKVAGFLS